MGKYLTYHIVPLIDAPKIHTDLLWDLAVLFVGLIVVYFTAVFFFKNRISSRTERVKRRKKELSPMISEFLFHEDDAPKAEKSNYVNLKIEIRQLLKNDFNREVLSEILLDLRKDVSGEAQKRLMKLYQDLGLHHDAFAKLKSWRWEMISKGILELTQMQVEESYGFVTKFINDKRGTIRKQAEIATVTLRNEGINYFLDTTKYRISEWQQLKLLDVLRNQEDFNPPRFKAWLTSNNKYVVLFAIRLIKYYNQNDANASLIELIKHKNSQIKEEAIGCIREFNVVEALDTLKLVFWKSPFDVKISILGAIAALGTEADIEFLKLIEKKEPNFAVRSKAISSINTIAPESIMPQRGIVQIKGNQIPEDIAPEAVEELEEEWDEPSTDEMEQLREKPLDSMQVVQDTEQITKEAKMEEVKEKGPSAGDEPDGVTSINLDFLPIVINNKEAIEETERMAESKEDKDVSKEDDFEVVFEEVIPPSLDEADTIPKNEVEGHASIGELDIDEIAFLPFVVENTLKEGEDRSIEEIPIEDKKDIRDKGPKEIIVEEIFALDHSDDQKEEKEILDIPKERPVTFDNEKKLETNREEVLSNIEMEYETVEIEPYKEDKEEVFEEFLEWSLEETYDQESMEFDFVLSEPEEKPIEKEDDKTAEIQDILKTIPKPRYYDGETIVTMRLLDDIEELGDRREIPLLKELLEKEVTTSVRDRIEEIIAVFELEKPQLHSKEMSESITDGFKPFSVFEDLFRSCDVEAKLILMDEIPDIGDEKEIDFLKSLLEDPEIRIRERVRPILDELQKRLFRESLSFEPAGAFVDDREDSENMDKTQDSFINQLFSIPNKIIEKLHG